MRPLSIKRNSEALSVSFADSSPGGRAKTVKEPAFSLPPSDEGGGKNEVFDGGRENAKDIILNILSIKHLVLYQNKQIKVQIQNHSLPQSASRAARLRPKSRLTAVDLRHAPAGVASSEGAKQGKSSLSGKSKSFEKLKARTGNGTSF